MALRECPWCQGTGSQIVTLKTPPGCPCDECGWKPGTPHIRWCPSCWPKPPHAGRRPL